MNDQSSYFGSSGTQREARSSLVSEVSRRKFLAGTAALAAGALLS